MTAPLDPAARAERLAQAMVDRLQPHVPGGVLLSRRGARIAMSAANGASGTVEFAFVFEEWDNKEPDRQYEHAIWLILEHVQDFIVELVLRERWPPAGGPIPETDPLPSSGARRVQGGFDAFYTPGLVLPMITDEELGY